MSKSTRKDALPATTHLLRPREACERLAIGRSNLYHLMSTGQLRYVRLGADRRIPESAIVEYIAQLEEAMR